MKKPIYKRWWFIVLMIPITLFALFIILGLAGIFDKEETTSATTVTTTQVSTNKTADTTLKNSVSTFSELTTSYLAIPNSDGKRSSAWDGIRGSKVTWSGTIIEVGTSQIYLIDSSKYVDGMTWDTVSGTDNEYYVFVAKFKDKINKEAFSVGFEETVTGTLESRGNDVNPTAHWKLYDVTRGQ